MVEPCVQEPEISRIGFLDVLAVREFRALWLAQILSLTGDLLAIVALTWLVYGHTRSSLLAAATFGLALLPPVIGGPVLAGLADRLPRRDVMIWCDLARAAVLLLTALPRMPIWTLLVLLFSAELLSAPFSAARAAILPDVLSGEAYLLGTAVTAITAQVGQVVGFAVSGLVVAALQPSWALVLDAVTFLLSAVLVRAGVRRRPAAKATSDSATRRWTGPIRWVDLAAGGRLITASRSRRILVGMAMLTACYVVPESLAVPFVARLGAGAAQAGLLLAAGPVGAVIGALVLSRWVPERLARAWMGPLAVGSCALMVGFVTRPGIAVATALLAGSGAASAYQLIANAAFVTSTPAADRGQAFGLVQALMSLAQGSAVLLAGALAQHWPPGTVIAAAGGIGAAAAAALALSWWLVERTMTR